MQKKLHLKMKCHKDYKMNKFFKVLFFSFILFSFNSNAVELTFNNSYKEAMELAKKENKNVVLFAHSPFCPWCIKMEEDTLSDKNIIKLLNDNFIFLMIDLSVDIQLDDVPDRFLPRGTPTTFVIDPNGEKLLYTLRGYHNAKSFSRSLSK